ncbi:MAG: proton-conducting transporter membrane subunit [bacterium]|nr:proton-conducting transporter membrane subunit [bacterium]
MKDIYLIIFSPFVFAVAVPYFASRFRSGAAWFAMLAPLASLWALIRLYGLWSAGGKAPIVYSFAWVAAAQIEVAFLVDGLSLMWGFLVAGMGVLIVLYSHWYLHSHESLGRYYGFLIAFMGSMLGVVFSDHLISLFIFWELTSITSYFLIGFWWDRKASVYGAQKAILITGGGGLAMLAGFILLGGSTGEWHISKMIANPGAYTVSSAALILILLGAFTKSAQWPFHIWLPSAMEAPTPISAFLHSATMVKAGIFLLSRLYPILGTHELWGYLVTTFGMITMIAGGLLSLRAYDLKAILAYGTISQLGLIVTFLGYGGQEAVIGSTLHLYNHAAAKAAMFMVVGIIDHESGTRDVRHLGHLARAMPKTHILAVIGALSLIGIPPFGGFITKEMLYSVSLHPGGPGVWAGFWPWITLCAGIITALYHLRFLGAPFWEGAERESPKHPHDPPLGMLAAPAALALLVILFGIYPGLIQDAFIAPAAAATLGQTKPLALHLALWHGVNTPLIMSIITVAAGLLLYWQRLWVGKTLGAVADLWRRAPAPDKIYDGSLRIAAERTYGILTLIQDGNLRRYMRMMMVATGILGLYLAARSGGSLGPWPAAGQWPLLASAICLFICIAAFATTSFRSRLPAILALGTVGYSTAVLYLILKAPDLALTQIVIESATVVLFLLTFFYLPELKPIASSPGKKRRDWFIAFLLGGGVTAVMAIAMNSHAYRTIADYYMRTSKPIAGFKNVVNAIIVDYRSYDTLGEITVLVIAGIAIHAMMRLTGEAE